jgi:amidase
MIRRQSSSAWLRARDISLLLFILVAFSFSVVHRTALAEFQIFEATIEEINRAFDEGSLTSEQLVQYYLERIEAFEDRGPAINALITVNPKALARARALDRERTSKGPRSPLHGIPIILKDNYDTADLPTTAGSVALKGSCPAGDGTLVERLRRAGAVVIGKANMSEFALSQGWFGYSSLGGLTRNPYNLKRNASGSSSGSAAAVSANFAVIATGTDTAGSVRAPAAVTGVVGLKPTLGLTSRSGIVPALRRQQRKEPAVSS